MATTAAGALGASFRVAERAIPQPKINATTTAYDTGTSSSFEDGSNVLDSGRVRGLGRRSRDDMAKAALNVGRSISRRANRGRRIVRRALSTVSFNTKGHGIFDPTKSRPLFPHRVVCDDDNLPHRRSWAHRLHLLLSDPEGSKLGSRITVLVLLVIMLSATALVIQTLPGLKEFVGHSTTGLDCRLCAPVGRNATQAEKDAREELVEQCHSCESVPKPALEVVETVCVVVFTVEYGLRLLTAYAVKFPFESDPDSIVYHLFHPQGLSRIASTPKHEFSSSRTKSFATVAERYNSCIWLTQAIVRTFVFVVDPLNILDLLAIVPFYVQLALPSFRTKLTIVRLFRLVRILRVPELGNLGAKLKTLIRLASDLLVYFAVFLIFSGFNITVFSSLVYYAEGGNWNKATGQYELVINFLGEQSHSLFDSIPTTMWWNIVTVTSVGYGDIAPVTTVGQLLAVFSMYLGNIMMSLPIAVMSITIAEFYSTLRHDTFRRWRVRFLATRALHTIHSSVNRPALQRAWNTWFQFAQNAVTVEKSQRVRVRGTLAPLRQKLVSESEGLVGISTAMAEETLECVRKELVGVKSELLGVWRENLLAIRQELVMRYAARAVFKAELTN